MGQGWAMDPPPRVGVADPPTYDPLYGFENGRKQRVMIATEEEMYAAKLPPEYQDYCAHILIDYHRCRELVWPQPWKCHHEKHAYQSCAFDDYVLRMKEFEREKRLLAREKRKQEGGH